MFHVIKSALGSKDLFLILIGLIILLIVSNKIINNYVGKKVRVTSKRYIYLKNYYDSLDVEPLDSSYQIHASLKSKAQLDNLNIERMIEYFISEPSREKLILEGKRNQYKLSCFLREKENGSIPAVTREQLKGVAFFKSKYIQTESNLVSSLEKELQSHIPTYSFEFTYTSPQGRNSYKREYNPDIDTLVSLINKSHEKEKHKQTAQYQRSLMSQSLRYDVMRRDGFRCVLCGRSASDGVQLHVDHIQPVSKGGKTELSNLRTLCQDCNLGKGAKYNPNGNN